MPLRHTDTNNVAVKLFSFHNKDKNTAIFKGIQKRKILWYRYTGTL